MGVGAGGEGGKLGGGEELAGACARPRDVNSRLIVTLTRSRRPCSAPNEQPCCQRCHLYLSLLGDLLFRLLQPRPFLAGKRSDQDPQRQIVHTDGGLLEVASLRSDGLRIRGNTRSAGLQWLTALSFTEGLSSF